MTNQDTIDAYPLHWPAAWPRTKYPEQSRFGVTFARARDNMLYELALLGTTNIIVSSNVELRRDGLPYANRSEPGDTGVAVYFNLSGGQKCIPVDRWDRVKDNLRAVGLTVAALRGLERWGAKHMVDAAFRGFDALPAGNTSGADPWWVVLGTSPHVPLSIAQDAYRRLVRLHHPDTGGSAEQFHRIQVAWEQARSMVR